MDKSQKITKKNRNEPGESVGQTQNSSRSHGTAVTGEAEKKPKSKLRTPTKIKRKRSRQPESPGKVDTTGSVAKAQGSKLKMQPEVFLISIDAETDQVTSSGSETTNSSKNQKKPVMENLEEPTTTKNGVQNGSEEKTSDGKENGNLKKKESPHSHSNLSKKSESTSNNHTKSDGVEGGERGEDRDVEEVVSDVILKLDDEESSQNTETTEAVNEETSFVSYDPSSMLSKPSVQVNDVVQDNFAIATGSSELEKPKANETFGETLKKIAGRRSLSRNVTLRDAMSPNSSMFVNVSMSTPEYKVLRHREGLGSPPGINGSSIADRKRKLNLDDTLGSKKAKTEQGFLNRSFEYLRGARSSTGEASLSTPNTSLDTKDKAKDDKKTTWQCRIM